MEGPLSSLGGPGSAADESAIKEMSKLMESASGGSPLMDQEEQNTGAAPVNPRAALTNSSPLLAHACAQHTMQLREVVARTAAVLSSNAPSIVSLQATADRLFAELQIPDVLASALAPLPLPCLPSVSGAAQEISSMDVHHISINPDLTLSWLPGGRPSTAATAVPPPLDHADRNEDRYLDACGYVGHKSTPSDGSDRSGCRMFSGLAAWQEAAADVLLLLLDVLDLISPHAQRINSWLSVGPFATADSTRSMPALLSGLLSASAWASYVPWSTPKCFHAARAVIHRCNCIISKQGGVTADCSMLAVGFPSSDHATMILQWTREVTKMGAWKDATRIPARYMVTWALIHLSSAELSAENLSHVLPTVLRFCDDWEVTNCWLGASILLHIITTATSSELQQHRLLITEVLRRLAVVRNPSIIALWSCTTALAAWLLYGEPILTLPLDPTCTRLDLGALNTAQDAAVLQMMQDSAISGNQQLIRASLFGLPLLILQCGRHFLRHVQHVVVELARVISEASDPDLVLHVMHVMRFIIHVASDSFTIRDDEYQTILRHGGYSSLTTRIKLAQSGLTLEGDLLDALSRCDLLEHVLCALFIASTSVQDALLIASSQHQLDELALSTDRLSCNILSLLLASPGTQQFASMVVAQLRSEELHEAEALAGSTTLHHSFSARHSESL